VGVLFNIPSDCNRPNANFFEIETTSSPIVFGAGPKNPSSFPHVINQKYISLSNWPTALWIFNDFDVSINFNAPETNTEILFLAETKLSLLCHG
jgi:hypothetical protein